MLVLLLFALIAVGLWWVRRADAPPPSAGPPSAPTDADWPRTDLPETADQALALVEVGRLDSSTGYDRDRFGDGWQDPDGNGCDARNDVLRRDLTAVTIRPGTQDCIVESGVLQDPYSGVVQRFRRGPATSDQVQIDHVVSLSDAWRTGAQAWTAEQRAIFANDPLGLLATLKATNSNKAYLDVGGWLPPRADLRCPFVARVVAVKLRYGLRMRQSEHDAAAGVLDSCPGQSLPR